MQKVPGIDIIQGGRAGGSLAQRTSMGIGGMPEVEVRVFDLAKIDALPKILEDTALPVHILGAGTNILARDGAPQICLLTFETGLRPEVVGREGEYTLMRCGADMRLAVLLAKAADCGLAGLSGLAGIPGSVGGALAMNAGSYGTSIGDHVRSMRVFSPLLGLADLPRERLEFSYRRAGIKGHEGWYLILDVTLALKTGRTEEIREHLRACMEEKKARQPLGTRSAGCVFKNPAPDVPAGRLLDEAGLKLEREGGMMFSDIHANFMLNTGNGLFRDALTLIERARARVLAASGWNLDLEVKLWT